MNNIKTSVIAVVIVMAATLFVPVSTANAQSLDLSELDCAVRAITPCRSGTASGNIPVPTTSTTPPQSALDRALTKIEADCQSLGELTELVLLADYQMATGVLADIAPPRVSSPTDSLVPELEVVSSNPVRTFYFTRSGSVPKVDSDTRALCQVIVSYDWGDGPEYSNFLTCRTGTKFFTTGLFAPYPSYEAVDQIMCDLIARGQLPGFTTDMTYLELFRSLTWTYRMATVCGLDNFTCWRNQDFWQERYRTAQVEAADEVFRAALAAQRAVDEAERALEEAQRAVDQARRASEEAQRSADE